ncbi:MAG: hypothetical protein H7644_11005 [Candidatus Heimdallarchaeota archaeon]|nr:hypothetical protein [Candidatus Heimdallarchaeota archaeon]MCK5144286.1 hypothetical protein [Candidatus Heimdallarchaeota archaeon]
MVFGYKKLLPAVLLLFILSNFNAVNAQGDVNYFSTKLKEGAILEWTTVTNIIYPEPENITNNIEITVLQDIPDQPIDYDFLYRYFTISISGEIQDDWMTKMILPTFIYPILYLEGIEKYTLYEHFLEGYEEYPDMKIEQIRGNVIVKGNATFGDIFLSLELIIHEKTGIVREKTSHYITDTSEFIVKTQYIGGMNLVKGEFIIAIFVVIGIPLIHIIIRKRKKTPPPCISEQFH